MENRNKTKILLTIYILLLVACAAFAFLSVKTNMENDDLQNLVNQQNAAMKDIKRRDSIYTANNKYYASIIKKYTSISSSKESFSIGIGKKNYSIDQFINLYGKLESDNYYLKDSIRMLKSEVNYYKTNISKFNRDMENSNRRTQFVLDSIRRADSSYKQKHSKNQ